MTLTVVLILAAIYTATALPATPNVRLGMETSSSGEIERTMVRTRLSSNGPDRVLVEVNEGSETNTEQDAIGEHLVEQTTAGANVVLPALKSSLRSERVNGASWAQIDSQGTVGLAVQEPDPAAKLATKLPRSNVEQTSKGSDVEKMMLKAPVRLHQNPEVSTIGTNMGTNSGTNSASNGNTGNNGGTNTGTKTRVPSDHPNDQKRVFVLPSWVQVLRDLLITIIIIMSIFYCVKAKINNTVLGGVDSERLEAESLKLQSDSGISSAEYRCAVMRITGMTCAICSATVQQALSKLDPVQKCEVDLINEKAIVQYRFSYNFDGKTLCDAVDDIGFAATLVQDSQEATLEAGQAIVHLQLDMVVAQAMDVKDSREAAKFLRGLAGIINVSTSGSGLTVTYDPAVIGSRSMLQTLKLEGYSTSWDPAGASIAGVAEAKKHTDVLTQHLLMAVILTACIVIMCWVLPCFSHCTFMMLHEMVPGLRTVTILMCLCACPVMMVCGRSFHTGAWHSIKSGIWDMNVLISLGTGLAFGYSVLVVLFAALAPAFFGFHRCKSPPDSYFETPCMIICFLLAGKSLESWAKQQTSQSLRDLLALQPSTANLLPAGSGSGMPEVVPAELLELNDVLQVFPGESAPSDGIMFNDGAIAEFDESLLTGESKPVKKRKGDFIVGGSRCVTGRAELKVERLGSKTTLSQIASLMEKAQLARAPVQQVADTVARIFVPCIILLACLTWVTWYVLVYRLEIIPMSSMGGSGGDRGWPELDKLFFVMEHGLTVLLVACPCALGLATPTAVMTSTGVAAKHGILIKSGAVPLELGSKLTHVVLDKTGTLTSGKPKAHVVAALEGVSPAWVKLLTAFRASSCSPPCASPSLPKISWLEVKGASAGPLLSSFATLEESERALWWAIGAAELSSEHPLAKELVNVANSAALVAEAPMTNFENITGVGVKGTVGGAEIFVGSAKRVLQCEGPNIDSGKISTLSEWVRSVRMDGSTVVAVSVDGTPLAAVALRDALSPYAKACIAELQNNDTEVWMCTGDHSAAAQAIAKECGVDLSRIVSEALPADKVALVQRLQEGKKIGKRNVVAMVGDGINDAPALAAADVGIAIGAGHNVTVDAADVVLVRTDLRDLVSFLALARDTLRTIWRNFLFAFLFNSLTLPVAAGALFHFNILMTPQIAICLMMSSSLFVVFSSLSLRSFRPKDTAKERK